MSEEVNNIINNLCDKLGYATSELTPEMARYMIAKDGATLLLSIVGIALGILAIVWADKHYKRAVEADPYYDSAIELVVTIVMAAVIFLALLETCIVSIDLVGWIASPKASMVEYVLNAVG